ncbi:MAG: alpha-amylase family glycosyl hydrolase [Phycisphaerales bacterium]|nr:alpha-amylase family glycosyl hydrolase [Phycisphaerales bacterium]
MHVNRIYFRGIKTFQRLSLLLLFGAILTGSGKLEKIEVEITPVSYTPRVAEIDILGACHDAQVRIELQDLSSISWVSKNSQVADKQEEAAVWSALVKFDIDAISQDPSSVNIVININCVEHGDQRIEKQCFFSRWDPLRTPDWAKGLVWYQVFPERFRDGNPNNNPNGWDVSQASWGDSFGEATTDEVEQAWNRRLVEPRRFRYRDDRDGGSVYNGIFARRYGGDLIGLYDQLESLAEQGYTGVYLCPVFRSRSLHKYDASDHRHIDPTLGHPGIYEDQGPGFTKLLSNEDPSDESTWEMTESDLWFVHQFLPKAKSLGLRVVLDGVWNHVGLDHFAFSDVKAHGIESEFVDWFDVHFDENGKLFAWQGWGQVNGSLPLFLHTDDGDIAPEPKAHIMAVTRRWMDPNGDGDPSDGIDGWRLDVAGEIGNKFWKDWRKQVRELNSEALIIGEIWSDAGHMFNDDGFDGQMNYPFAYAVADWLSIGNSKGDAKLCASRLASVFNHEPEHDLVQFNLMTSHDTERLASMMHNDFERGYDNNSSRWSDTDRYEVNVLELDDYQRALSAIATMVASPGALMMYNGDEYAMDGADDPDNRRPIPWEEITNRKFESDVDIAVRFHQEVCKLLKLRNEDEIGEILRFGGVEFEGIETGELAGTLIIRRSLNNQIVEFLVPSKFVNPSNEESFRASIDEEQLSESLRNYGLVDDSPSISVRIMLGKDW